MGPIKLIPLAQPLTPDQLVEMLAQGWVLVGQQLVVRNAGIVTPDNPQGAQAEPVNVWVQNVPTMPVVEVLNALVETEDTAGALDLVCQRLFGSTLDELKEGIANAEQQQSILDGVPPVASHKPTDRIH